MVVGGNAKRMKHSVYIVMGDTRYVLMINTLMNTVCQTYYNGAD